jgi:hypothetical protein
MGTMSFRESSARPVLRLVWSRPRTLPLARRRIDLARAIERHLAGGDGLTDEEFVTWHATGRPPFLRPAPRPAR